MKHFVLINMIIAFGVLTLQASDTTVVQKYKPVNNYSGLNSLMKRLANPSWNGTPAQIGTGLKLEQGTISPLNGTSQNATTSPVTSSGSYAGENAEPLSLYLRDMEKGEVPVGPPVFVFFRLAGRLHHGFCDGLSGEERGAGPRPGGTSGEADERGVSWRRGSRSGPREGLPPTNPSPRIGTAG